MSADLDFRERTWGTADGRRVRFCDMDLGHLVNVLNWVTDHDGRYPSRVVEDLTKEAEYRRVFSFANCEPYAGFIDNRWKIIDPKSGKTTIQKPPKEYIEAVKDHPGYQEMSAWVQKKRKTRD